MTAPRKLQLRRGNSTATSTYVGAPGELIINTDNSTLYVHDGVTVGGHAATVNTVSLTNAIASAEANIILANTIQLAQITTANTGIKGYVDLANSIQSAQITSANLGIIGYINQSNTIQSAQVGAANLAITVANVGLKGYVDLANTIQAAAITAANLGMKGYVDSIAGGSSYGNANVKVYLSNFDGNIIPSANTVYSLGSVTNQWRDLFVSNNTIYVGGVPLGIDATGNLTVNGNVIPTISYVNTVVANVTVDLSSYALNANVTAANVGLKGYVDQANTIQGAQLTSANLGVIGYIDLANTIQSAQVGAANLAITAANVGLKGYVDSQSFYSNVKVATYLPTYDGNIAANISKAGYTWTFGTTGNLTIPGSIIGTSDINIDNRASSNTADIQLYSADDILLQARDRPVGNGSEGGDINIFAGDSAVDSDTSAGDVEIRGGDGGASDEDWGGSGGYVTIQSGQGGAAMGANYSARPGGALTLRAGDAGTNNGNIALGAAGGNVIIEAGDSTANGVNGGTIYLTSGAADASALAGDVVIQAGGTWTFGGTGTTQFPNSLILAPVSQSITMQSDQYSQLMWENANLTVAPNMAINSNFYVAQNSATLDIGYRDGSSTQLIKSWYWSVDGNLKLPSGGYILNSDDSIYGAGSSYSNVEVATYLQSGNIANISVAGNVTATYFVGNGALLTGIVGGASNYGNIDVKAFLGTDAGFADGYQRVIEGYYANIILGDTTKLFSYGSSAKSYFGHEGSGNTQINYVRADNGDVRIATNNASYNWIFDRTGNLTLPYGAIIRDSSINALAIGTDAGNVTNTQNGAIAIGYLAGSDAQNYDAVAIGSSAGGGAGGNAQGQEAVAVGSGAGMQSQGIYTVAVGSSAGGNLQSIWGVAVGHLAGETIQGIGAVAFGASAGYIGQGAYAVAIGNKAGVTNQGNNSIIINATGNVLNQTTANTFTVAPIRTDSDNTAQALYYNTLTKEITYANVTAGGSNYGNVNVAAYLNTQGYNLYSNVNVANYLTTATITTTGNVTAANFVGNISITGNVTGTSANVTLQAGAYTSVFDNQGNVTVPRLFTAGNIQTAGYFVGNGTLLTGVAIKTTGSWTVPTGNSTQSFTVPASGTYQLWVDCNIPNGILAWNAIATVTNSNVPVVGEQYAWVYNGGGTPIDFTSIPNQFVGTGNTIVRSSVSPSVTTNRFDFGINNTSGGNVTVSYGYVKIS